MKKEFLSYFTLGYPGIKENAEIIKGAIDGGATGIEIGIPFSDPIADGGVIQYAHHIAITKGIKTEDAFILMDLLGKYKERAKFYVMSYLNPIINYQKGLNNFIYRLKEIGIRGLILPDLPFAEAKRGKVNIDFPLIMKPRRGSGSKDVYKITNGHPQWIKLFIGQAYSGKEKLYDFRSLVEKIFESLKE